MGLLDIASKYEKMLENPENQGNSSGTLTQQTVPSLSEASGSGSRQAAPAPQTLEDSDDLWIKELDKRMAKKSAVREKIHEVTGNDAANRILHELNEVKGMLKLMMDVNLKLLEKLK